MADKARDLQFRVLSDLSKLDLDKGARQFDDLADAGKRALEQVDDSVDSAAKGLRDLTDESRDTASKVKRAFNDIGDSSKQTFRRDVDDDLHKAGQSFDDFKDEAKANVSEVASSFRGDLSSSIDLVQGTLGGLAGSLGGIGGVIAAAAGAAGVGLIAKAFETAQAKAEELREATTAWTQALIDGTAESLIQQNLNTAATEDGGKALRDWTKRAEEAGIVTQDYVRAMAGDKEARDRILPGLLEQDKTLTALSRTTKGLTEDQLRQSIAIADALDPLNAANQAIAEGTKNANALRDATNRPYQVQLLTKIQVPTPKELDAIRRDVRDGIGVIPVQLRVSGQSPYANNSNNSRYRN